MSQNKHIQLKQSQQSQLQGSEIELQPQPMQVEAGTKYSKIFITIIVAMILSTIYNISQAISRAINNDTDPFSLENKVSDLAKQQTKIKDLVRRIQSQYNQSKYTFPLKSTTKERISYGQARPRNNFMRAVIITQKNGKPAQLQHCILTNGISIISSKTIYTGRNFLAEPDIYKWVILLAAVDGTADGLIAAFIEESKGKYVKQNVELTVDANYNFLWELVKECQATIYLQNNFYITEDNVKKFVNASAGLEEDYKSGYMGYTAFRKNARNQAQQLLHLKNTDLSTIKQQKFSEYIFIFDSAFLPLLTPFNFVPFNKYTIEQLLILPILALTQKSSNLVPIKTTTHMFDTAVVQFREFQLKAPVREGKALWGAFCFVGYPVVPEGLSLAEFKKYVKSLKQVTVDSSTNVSVVVSFAYDYDGRSQGLFQVYKLAKQLKQANPRLNIRLRIHQDRAVSSLSMYEAAHTYCPESSIIIASRYNTMFNSAFLTQLALKITDKYHYYYPGSLGDRTVSQIFLSKSQRRQPVKKQLLDFVNVQIFKSDLMKMIHVWTLKVNETSFFEAETSYILPMIEMCGYEVLEVVGAKFQVSTRRAVPPGENKELDMINRYYKWDKIKDNKLKPIKYNSLTNLNLRRGALDLIPKKLHQIWLKPQSLPQTLKTRQSQLQSLHKGYNYTLWTLSHLTVHDFPMSYHLIARVLEHQSRSQRSYHAWVQALMSYEVLYNEGGIYLSLYAEAKKSLDPFLKYELLFAGFYNSYGSYDSPWSVGRQVIGSKKHSYHLRLVLTQLITIERLNIDLVDYEALIGGDVLCLALTTNELYTTTAFGFNLFTYDPHRTRKEICDAGTTGKDCQEYGEAYIVLHNLV